MEIARPRLIEGNGDLRDQASKAPTNVAPAILQNKIKILSEEKFGGKLREYSFEIHISEIQGKNRRLEAYATFSPCYGGDCGADISANRWRARSISGSGCSRFPAFNPSDRFEDAQNISYVSPLNCPSKTLSVGMPWATFKHGCATAILSRDRLSVRRSTVHECHGSGNGEFVTTFIFRMSGMAANQRKVNIVPREQFIQLLP